MRNRFFRMSKGDKQPLVWWFDGKSQGDVGVRGYAVNLINVAPHFVEYAPLQTGVA